VQHLLIHNDRFYPERLKPLFPVYVLYVCRTSVYITPSLYDGKTGTRQSLRACVTESRNPSSSPIASNKRCPTMSLPCMPAKS